MAGFSGVVVYTLLMSLAKLVQVGSANSLPYFHDLPDSIKVNENTKVGSIITNITVKDLDSSDQLTISLDSIGDELFMIGTPNGNSPLTTSLSLKTPLDREARNEYTIKITVKDDYTSENREDTKSVLVFVLDYNDNAPVFQGTPYSATIKENTPSSMIYKVSATDDDLGSAKSIQYSFVDECKSEDCQLFVIDSTKGEVSLNTSFTLDYETKNRYNLLIMAKDRGTPSLNSSTTLVIEVLDESDQPPEFEKSSYRADIREDIAVGTSVVETKALDGDRGINNPVTYAIVAGDTDHYFKIDTNSGEITVNMSIDRDTGNDFFELIVQATETTGNEAGNTTVFLTIQDVNDNRPTFPSSGFPYTTVIPEDTPVGTPIFFQMGAYDNDREASNARFEYSISGDPHYFFKIDPNIGRIELNRTLDFENEQQFTFLVIAKETSSVEKYSANQTISVNVSNVNDHEPIFNHTQYNFTVSESTSTGTILGNITATDRDSGIFGEITYSLTGFGSEKFSVVESDGTLSVAGSLDFETISSYDLILEAKDGGNRITRVNVKIRIMDYNDNIPIFDPLPASATLNENQGSGFLVVVKASDKDADNNSLITYSIVSGDPLHNFTIDPTSGNITNVGPLDYETQSNFQLVIMAKDQGLPPLNSTRELPITINDQNDNEPYFNQTLFNVDLMENTDIDELVVRLFAFDVDSGKNAELIYSIVSGNDGKKFTIDADGVLLTRSSPDREKTSVYTLNISVSDVGTPKKYAYAKVVVNILDENDESPKFTITVDKKYIEEGPTTVNSVIAKNTAIDGDEGLDGTIEYKIADGNNEGNFTINNETGEVTVASELDFEEVRIYSLKIEASDKGVPSRSGEYQLVVEVTDINDNVPVFDQTEYSFTVLENRPNNTVIVTLRADDRDYGKNKLITYSIVYGNVGSAFSINNETGQISTNKVLDRETEKQYLLVVKAKDHGVPSLESTTNVTITVRDENDQTPSFANSSYNISIPENSAKGTSVFTVSATDSDDGPAGQVSYLMQDVGNLENGNSVFSVGSKSGEVKTAINLDFEIHRTFTLTITASDNGAPSLSSNLTLLVTIADIDDNPPEFTNDTWSATVNENAKPGTVIIQMKATDKDFEVAHKTIFYKIDGGNDDAVFSIWPENGTVYLLNPTKLDRETKNTYELTIKAETLNEFKNITVQETTTKLTISVEDYNDYAPVFQEDSYSKKIPESFELNEIVVTVVAKDEDVGINQKISYYILSGNDDGIFSINNETGVVTIVKKLDRETKDFHTLIVVARDHGIPSLENNVTITITVTDTNDKNPTLLLQGNSFTVFENATIGTIVTQFNATDEDLNKNAEVGYRIVSGNDNGVFIVDNKTGVLSTAKLLDHETVKKYQIGIQAYDHGTPTLQSDIKIVTVDVKDVNDNLPTFESQKTVTLSVFENEGTGAVVGTIKASDADVTDPLYYYIRGGNGADKFSINEFTGVVSTTSLLDREKNDTYYIYVQVFNTKQTQQYIESLGSLRKKRSVLPDNIQLVVIKIDDKNDNPPTFKYNYYKAGVSESALYGSRITQITCLDKDIGNNSRLIYTIVDLQPEKLLTVEPETGWILAGQQKYFADGVGKTYKFKYSCSDSLSTATTNVTIFVLVDDQRVRLTLKINDTNFVRDNIDEIKQALNDATGLEFNDDSIQYHLQADNKYDLTKTDIFMHAVDPKTNKVVDKETALKLIDKNWAKLRDMFQKYNVDAVEPKQPDSEENSFDLILAIAIALGVILFMVLLCFFCVICLMRRSHNRKLRAAKAIGSQDQNFVLSTPGTNLHVYEGSNPVWMDPYDNWKTGDDRNSNTAKLYEAQELSMDMFRDESPENSVLPGTLYESSGHGASYHPNGVLHLQGLDNEGVEDEVTNI